MQFPDDAADDIGYLILLHHREVSADVLAALHHAGIGTLLGLPLTTTRARLAVAEMDGVLAIQPDGALGRVADALAVEYANIYLTHGYRASPTESVWFDDEGLERQAPLFQVRNWYRRFGLVLGSGNRLPDDHLANQLRFLVHLLRLGEVDEAGRFLDEHLLRWVPLFADRVTARAYEPFYIALGELTAAYLEVLRDRITRETGLSRPGPGAIESLVAAKRRVGCMPEPGTETCAGG